VKLNSVNIPASPIILGAKARVVPTQSNPFARFQTAVSSGTVNIDATVGISLRAQTIQLLRGANLDINTAALLQSWAGPFTAQQDLTFSDSGATATAYYWLRIIYDATTNTKQDIGPQVAYITPIAQGTVQVQAFSASVNAGTTGTVKIGITFERPTSTDFSSAQIVATGYNGIAGQQVLAQSANSGFSFALNATGETIVLQANAVSLSGKAITGGPLRTVTLVAVETVPCVVYDGSAISVANGNQVTWPQSPESDTTYQVNRDGSLIATIPHGLESTVNYLDLVASPATHTYTIVATNGVGSAAASPTITPGATTGGMGTGATAAALTVPNGTNKSVSMAYVTAQGSNYFQTPLITFSGSSLSQDASGTVALDGSGHPGTITVTNPGLYAAADTVSTSIHY
jgi:hypothetical protein